MRKYEEIMRSRTFAIAALLATALQAPMAQAQGTSVVNTHDSWTVYSHKGDPADICFITSQPRETKPADVRRDRAYFYVSSWVKDGIRAQVSVLLGYDLENDAKVDITIGNRKFELFAKDDKAFVSNATEELQLIDAMKRGNVMTVSAEMKDGTRTEDKYSLIGVTAAINGLSGGCR